MEGLLNRKISRKNLIIVKKILVSFVKEAQDICPAQDIYPYNGIGYARNFTFSGLHTGVWTS
jgi:hypothetical protein